MAGNGPAPKDPRTRARRNADPITPTYLHLPPADAPELPATMDWHSQTLIWWDIWTRSPLTDKYTEGDWNYLIDTALIHSAFWNGDLKLAAELRNRMAKFGATPEDRAKLRIFNADADDKESRGPQTASQPKGAARRFEGLQLVDPAKDDD